MFAFNGERINLSNTKHPFVKDYLEKTAFLSEYASSYIFKYPARMIRPRDPLDKESKEGKPIGVEIKWSQRYQFGDNTGEVTYYESSRVDTHGKDVFIPRSFDFNGEMILYPEKDMEKIFFLIFVNQFIEACPDIPGQNVIRNKNRYMYLHQPGKIVRRTLDDEVKATEARGFVYNAEVGLNMEELKQAAVRARLGIHNIEKFTEDDLRFAVSTELFSKKGEKYNMDVIGRFLDVARAISLSRKKASQPTPHEMIQLLIETALDKKAISYINDAKNGHRFWRYDDTKDTIIKMDPLDADHENDLLLDFYLTNLDKVERLKDAIQSKM